MMEKDKLATPTLTMNAIKVAMEIIYIILTTIFISIVLYPVLIAIGSNPSENFFNLFKIELANNLWLFSLCLVFSNILTIISIVTLVFNILVTIKLFRNKKTNLAILFLIGILVISIVGLIASVKYYKENTKFNQDENVKPTTKTI
ncbi:hypothetical protein DMC14_000635 [Metamycoplasma phocicerebrale]|uniref:Uncharacterized protein n=1 Tax=Metamycoplasma phocicerebrale TaxID=142649 RepID=A0A3T0TTD3_9BACT|nr:hypothetical protein [Metamycoplasma phocicerebrale]AZZ65308.2 hypothetical protein DMC14_000635 [Metamycoplasma phocicerebrale]